MRNFETFRTEEELLRRIAELEEAGYSNDEYEVLTANEVADDRAYHYNRHDIQPGYNHYIDDPAFINSVGKYGWDEATTDEAASAIENGYYILRVNRDGFYDDPALFDRRADYVDEDIRERDDLTRDQKIRLHEERLRVRKDRVESGEVNINKSVVTERETIEVPVEKERVTIERTKVDEVVDGDFDDLKDENIRIPLHEERVSVDKENVVTEEINVKTDVVEETERVSEEVRKEQVEIDSDGDVERRN